MNNNEFDRKIKELVDSYEEPADIEMWNSIEKGLERGSRLRFMRRIGYAAVAASLVAGAFVFVPKEDDSFTSFIANNEINIAVEPTLSVDQPSTLMGTLAPQRTFTALLSNQSSEVSSVEVIAQNSTKESPKESQKEQTDNKVSTPKEEPSQIKVLSKVEENQYLAMDDTPIRKKRDLTVAASSNLLALSSSTSSLNLYPSFSSGSGSSTTYTIRSIEEPSHSLPLSFGLQLQISLSEKIAAGIGFNYSIFSSRYDAIINNTDEALVNQILRYVGVPLSIYVNIINNEHLVFYCNAGGMIEKGLMAKYTMEYISGAKPSTLSESVPGFQWSVNAGIGLEYKIIDFLGLYLDPSLTYFFDCNQPYSIRKEQPLQLKLELGLRFHI